MPAKQEHYIKDTFLADRYGVSRSTIWRWVQSGRLPQPLVLTPGTTRWRLVDIEAAEAGGLKPKKHPTKGRNKGSQAIRSTSAKFKALWPLCCDVETGLTTFRKTGAIDDLIKACDALSGKVEELSRPLSSEDNG